MLARKNLNKIKGQFSSLLIKVQSALKSYQVDVDEVHSFLVHYSSRDDWIQNPSNLDEIFKALSVAKLWNYDHYDLLEEITKRLLPEDTDVKKLITEYKGQLTGFYTTTKIADFIELSKYKDSEQDPEQPFPVDSFTLKNYRKLKLKLKLNRKVSAVTLSYVDELWRSLAEEFDLPCLTAVIHSIIEGSLLITWLVLPHIAEKIITSGSTMKAVKFFRCHGIVLIEIDNNTVYDEEQMIKYEDQLYEICSEGSENVSILTELQNHGVDFNMFISEGYTPLCLASCTGNSNVVRSLLEHGAHVNKRNNDKWGSTPLMSACCNNYISAAKILVENGAVVDLLNKVGQSSLYVASGYGQAAAVRFLIENRADVNLPTCNAVGYSALIAACLGEFVDVVRVLLEHGANVDYQDKKGHSALFISSMIGCIEVVKILLKFGAQVNLQTSDFIGLTPLTVACVNGHIRTAKILIEHGAIVDFFDKKGHSSLYEASSNGRTETVRLLLQNGADVNLITEDGLSNSALISTCFHRHLDTARVLLDHGARVNHQNKNRSTALFYAADQGCVDIVELLMEHGVELELKNKSGLTAYDVASINSHPDVCCLMEAYGYQADHSTSSETRSWSGRRCDKITSLEILQSILQPRSSPVENTAMLLKHQASDMSEENEETM